MVRSNLLVVLAERNLKIADVWRGTGISRTTLQGLVHNGANGIQFETMNKLCSFLGVTPGEILLYYPFEYDVIFNGDPGVSTDEQESKVYVQLTLSYNINGKNKTDDVWITSEKNNDIVHIHIHLEDTLFDEVQKMPKIFANDIEDVFAGYGMRANSDDAEMEYRTFLHRGLNNI